MNSSPKVINACLVVIGNEILSGRTQDANLAFTGKRCDELGIQLKEVRVIPDEEDIIIATVNRCRTEFDYVFTTGGIGPTHDDITAASVAKAFNVLLEQNAEAVSAMQKYYKDPAMLNDARLRMANIPAGAKLIDNPVSGAPGFQMENVFVLPGVPLIMQAMFDGMTDRLVGGAPVLTESITTNLREGVLAGGLATIQESNPDVTLGSYPFFREGKLGVNLVMRGTDRDQLDKTADEVRILIKSLDGRVFD